MKWSINKQKKKSDAKVFFIDTAKPLIGQKCNKGFLAVFVFVLQEGAEKLTSNFNTKDAVKWCQDIWGTSGDI